MSTPITAKAVSELRQRTGAGMMDCKKALEESGGDMDAAVEYLRMKGMAKADKRADRSAKEGIVGNEILNDGKSGVLVEVGCERTRCTQRRFRRIREQARGADGEIESNGRCDFPRRADGWARRHSGRIRKAESAKTGELTVVKRVARFDAGANGQVGVYAHHNKKLAVLVQVTAAIAGSRVSRRHAGTHQVHRRAHCRDESDVG